MVRVINIGQRAVVREADADQVVRSVVIIIPIAECPVADFADTVTRLLKDEAFQAKLAVNGRLLAEKCYDWQVVLGKMEEIYQGVASRYTKMGRSNG